MRQCSDVCTARLVVRDHGKLSKKLIHRSSDQFLPNNRINCSKKKNRRQKKIIGTLGKNFKISHRERKKINIVQSNRWSKYLLVTVALGGPTTGPTTGQDAQQGVLVGGHVVVVVPV
jgi:hypothetical protein